MPRHVVVDGSNLATEGRSVPSLKQLEEAVQAFIAEHPTALITVVVDATFGHRIDPKEVPEFDAAIDHNELVAPPAGAVGRGDAFVLAIADKVNATIISNDSYQEFHGDYPWLFDEGRLIGGKPVPHVGWVFVTRVPVRGPLSRRSQREAKQKDRTEERAPTRRTSKAAAGPVPVPTAPPPGAVLPAKGRGRGRKEEAATAARPSSAPVSAGAPTAVERPAPAAKVDVPTPARSTTVNDLIPFITFVEHHPVGSTVSAVVESYSSHGAYVTVGDARAYIPLRYMADPAPRSARELMKIGDEVPLVVVAFHAARRGIDLAVPALAPGVVAVTAAAEPATTGADVAAPAKRTRRGAKASTSAAEAPTAEAPEAPSASRPAKRTRRGAATEHAEDVAPVASLETATPAATDATKTTKATKRPAKRAGKAAATETGATAASETSAAQTPEAETPAAETPAAEAPAAGPSTPEVPRAKKGAPKPPSTPAAKTARKRTETQAAPAQAAPKQAAAKQAAAKQARTSTETQAAPKQARSRAKQTASAQQPDREAAVDAVAPRKPGARTAAKKPPALA